MAVTYDGGQAPGGGVMREVLLISHELRTPLAVISGYLEMLDEEELSEAQRHLIRQRMRQAVGDLDRAIEALIGRQRLVADAYGLAIPELIAPALDRSREEILGGASG